MCQPEARLINGKLPDSSYQRKETISFPLYRVIAGWTEGRQRMPTGSKDRLYISSKLGYGARGAGHHIPPHSALIFDVEPISIRSADDTPSPAPPYGLPSGDMMSACPSD